MNTCKICNEKLINKYNLKRHMAYKHDIDVTFHFCETCGNKFKSKRNLKSHMAYKHDIDVIYHFCETCNDKFKCQSDLKSHMALMHDIDVIYQYCKICNHKSKTKRNLKKHMAYKHDIDVIYHFCETCNDKFKCQSDLKRHKSSVHDIGDFVCEYLNHNVAKVFPYTDPKTKITNKICRVCYRKATGYNTTKEEDMVKYLKEIKEIKDHIVLTDSIIKGDICNTRRRPDLLITSPRLNIVVECDEFQHRDYDISCESGRLDEIFDELKTGKILVIKWNPDNFKVENKTVTIKRKIRLEKLKETILYAINNIDKYTEPIHIIYMFYSDNSKLFPDRWSIDKIYA